MNDEKRSKVKWRFKSQDGLELFAHAFPADNDPKAVVCIVHGHGEHIERYEHVAAAFNRAGYSVIGYDQRGHGQSDGPRGHTPSYDMLLDDLTRFRAEVKDYYPNIPHFIYGHSMGGNLTLNYILRKDVANLSGAIVTGPCLRLSFEPSPVRVFLGRTMDKIYPAFTQSSGLETTALARDEAVVKAYENDPYVHSMISARLFVAMCDAGPWAVENAVKLKTPLLLMHGSADRLSSAEQTRKFAENAGDLVTLKIWDGLYHELHNEPEKEDVFKMMIEWMDNRLQ